MIVALRLVSKNSIDAYDIETDRLKLKMTMQEVRNNITEFINLKLDKKKDIVGLGGLISSKMVVRDTLIFAINNRYIKIKSSLIVAGLDGIGVDNQGLIKTLPIRLNVTEEPLEYTNTIVDINTYIKQTGNTDKKYMEIEEFMSNNTDTYNKMTGKQPEELIKNKDSVKESINKENTELVSDTNILESENVIEKSITENKVDEPSELVNEVLVEQILDKTFEEPANEIDIFSFEESNNTELKGNINCKYCKGTQQKYVGGIPVYCDCKEQKEVEERKKSFENRKPITKIRKAEVDILVELGIIPEHRKEDEFSKEEGMKRIISQYGAMYKVVNYEKLTTTMDSIIAKCSMGGNLGYSYILGGENGFGKTTFVNHCNKLLYAKGHKVTPYISLLDLAKLRAEHESDIREKMTYGFIAKKKEEDDYLDGKTVIHKYKWDDYMESEILFCYLTGSLNAKLESEILKLVLNIRGTKGLSTIVTIDSSIDMYMRNSELRMFVWDTILNRSELPNIHDRLVHRSGFITRNTSISRLEPGVTI